MIYNKETGKVLLAKLSASEQMIADNVGKSTSKVEDYWRVKTYVKPADMVEPHYPKFPEPYQIGQFLFGGTWNEYNQPFIVQVAQCNIDCWYCFVGKELRSGQENINGVQMGDWFSAQEVVDMWKASGSKVLRVSGGEPTIAAPFLIDLMELMDDEEGLLWIDTNLSTGDWLFKNLEESKILDYISGQNICFCACFKGFTKQDAAEMTRSDSQILDRQIAMASRLIKETDFPIFFYIPGLVHTFRTGASDIADFFNRMRNEVDENAPLRTYILEIKNYSPTETDYWDKFKGDIGVADRNGNPIRPIDVWTELKNNTYPPELVWLPDYQVPFKSRD